MSPVGHLVFKTSEVLMKCLVGSTPTSSANFSVTKAPLINTVMPQRSLCTSAAPSLDERFTSVLTS